MAGALTHIGIGIALYIIVYLIGRKHIYGIAIFVGHLFPDAFKFGLAGIKLGTFSFSEIVKEPLFYTLDAYSGTMWHYLVLFAGIALIALSLLAVGKIKKQTAYTAIYATLAFIIGAAIHILIDMFIIEANPWI